MPAFYVALLPSMMATMSSGGADPQSYEKPDRRSQNAHAMSFQV